MTGKQAKKQDSSHLKNSVQIGSSEGLCEMLSTQHDVKFLLMNTTFMNETSGSDMKGNTSLLPPHSLFKSVGRTPMTGLDPNLTQGLMSPTGNRGLKLPPMELSNLTSPKTNLALPSSMRSSFHGGTGLLLSRLSKETRHRHRADDYLHTSETRRMLEIGGAMKARVK